MDKAEQEELVRLLKTRAEMEKEIAELNEVLKANKNVGMDESLVDDEGFPRTDIDVYQVKHARAKLIREQNDYKTLMRRCEDLVVKYHSRQKPEGDDKSGLKGSTNVPQNVTRKLAIVGSVYAGSPCEAAGLRVGDIIIEFGGVNSSNMKDLNTLFAEAEKSLDSYVKVIIERDSQIKRINMKPKAWAGEGFLGCKLYPVH